MALKGEIAGVSTDTHGYWGDLVCSCRASAHQVFVSSPCTLAFFIGFKTKLRVWRDSSDLRAVAPAEDVASVHFVSHM